MGGGVGVGESRELALMFYFSYEAFVIYTFYSLLISFVGGYEQGKEIFSQRGKIKLAIPLCCIQVHPRRGLLRQCKRLTLQYVIIRPCKLPPSRLFASLLSIY